MSNTLRLLLPVPVRRGSSSLSGVPDYVRDVSRLVRGVSHCAAAQRTEFAHDCDGYGVGVRLGGLFRACCLFLHWLLLSAGMVMLVGT